MTWLEETTGLGGWYFGPRITAAIALCVALAGCVSSEAPSTLNVASQADAVQAENNSETPPSDEAAEQLNNVQNPAQEYEGGQIAVPQLNPQKLQISTAQLNQNNQQTEQTESQVQLATDSTEIADNQQIQNQINQKPVTAKKSQGLLALLFQRPAKKQPPARSLEASQNPVMVKNTEGQIASSDELKLEQDDHNNTNEIALLDNPDQQRQGEQQNVEDTGKLAKADPQTENDKIQKKKKPGLFSFLFQPKNKKISKPQHPKDDRMNSILLSSRTASRSNRYTTPPKTGNLTDIPGSKNENSETKVASAAALLRNPFNGIATQHSRVDVDCITPGVIRILNVVEKHYGKKPVVSSGYRSPSRNRRAGGARNSMHIYCRAVDIQVKGVSKWQLAKFLRTVKGRGGVGTYCRTKSVHIDTGPKRDWHIPCRRKSKRRKKA